MSSALDQPEGDQAGAASPTVIPATCRAFLHPCLARIDRRHTLVVRLAHRRLALCASTPGLLTALAEAFREFAADEGPVDDQVDVIEVADGLLPSWPDETDPACRHTAKESYRDLPDGRIVHKRRTGIRLVFGPGGNAVVGPCRRHLDQVVNAVICRFMERELAAGAVLLHAAAVSDGARGLAIAGLAGAGKSTLALELTRRGGFFVSNDRLLVAAGPHGPVMTGLPRAPRVNPGTLLANDCLSGLLSVADRQAFSRLSPEALRRVERKYDVPIDRCFGPGRFRLRADLAALVMLGWQAGGGPLRAAWTRLAAHPELIPAVHKDLGPLVAMGPRPADPAETLAVLGAHPLLYLTGGVDFEAAASLCQAVLTRSIPVGSPV